MMMQPPSSTPTCPIFPYTTLFRSGSGNILIAQIGGQRVAVDFRFEPGVSGDGLQFGRKDQRASGPAIIERFLADRSEEHTYELQSLMRISDADFCLKTTHQLSRHTMS